MLRRRENQLLHEFSFWGEPQPRTSGHIYELRSYHLKASFNSLLLVLNTELMSSYLLRPSDIVVLERLSSLLHKICTKTYNIYRENTESRRYLLEILFKTITVMYKLV